MAEPIEMQFGTLNWVGPGTRGVDAPTAKGTLGYLAN